MGGGAKLDVEGKKLFLGSFPPPPPIKQSSLKRVFVLLLKLSPQQITIYFWYFLF